MEHLWWLNKQLQYFVLFIRPGLLSISHFKHIVCGQYLQVKEDYSVKYFVLYSSCLFLYVYGFIHVSYLIFLIIII